jgi:hypothetical protein
VIEKSGRTHAEPSLSQSRDLGVFAVNAAGPGLRRGHVIYSGVLAVAAVAAVVVSWFGHPSAGPAVSVVASGGGWRACGRARCHDGCRPGAHAGVRGSVAWGMRPGARPWRPAGVSRAGCGSGWPGSSCPGSWRVRRCRGGLGAGRSSGRSRRRARARPARTAGARTG